MRNKHGRPAVGCIVESMVHCNIRVREDRIKEHES